MKVFEAKREMKMAGSYMWERKGRSGSCRCCGQYIKDDELYYLVIINGSEFSKEFPKELNFIVHKEEYDRLAKDFVGDEYEAIRSILSKRRKSASNRTPVDDEMVKRFRTVASELRLCIVKETSNRIYFKPPYRGRIGDFVFDKRSKRIYYNGRGFNGIFDRMFLREFISRIDEKLNEKEEGFRVEKAMGEARKQVESIMR